MDSGPPLSHRSVGDTMKRLLPNLVLIFLVLQPVLAQESDDADAAPSDDQEKAPPEDAKELSGMSILGNEETPKSLVIVPWKSSEMGDELSLSDSLDDRAKPVDKEVFLRELSFYEIRSTE